MDLTIAQLKAIMPNAKLQNITLFYKNFLAYKWLHKMTEALEVAAFISQIAQETNELIWIQELATGAEYEGRIDLGNTLPGDGVLFKGRAYLQLTGRFNYRAFTKWYNENFIVQENFVKTPERIAQEPELWMLASIFFWKTNGLDQFSIYSDCKKTTKKINGGYNGFNERLKYFNLAKKTLL
jgi:putative chitinase